MSFGDKPNWKRRALDAERQLAKTEEALREARPYVFNRTLGDTWRAEPARDVLARIDALLAAKDSHAS